MSDAKIKKNKSSFLNENLRGTLINIGIILVAFITAVTLFGFYRNYEAQRERDSLVQRAKEAYDKGDYSQSINIFLTAEGEFPNNLEVKRYLGELYYFKGKYNEVTKYFERVKLEQSLTDKEVSYLGNSYIQLNKNEDAISLWKSANLSANDRYKLANIYLSKKDSENYFLELDKIKEYQEPLLYLQVRDRNLTNILSNIDKALAAKSLSDEYIDIDLFKSQITEAKKQADFNKRDYSELIQLAAFANLNQCQFIGDRVTALKTSLESQKIPTYQVEFLQGKCFNQDNNADAAIPLINKAISSETTNLDYREELARSYFIKKDLENLKKVYNDIFVLKKNSDLYSNLAAYEYQLNYKTDAISTYKTALSLAEDDLQKVSISSTIIQIEFLDNKDISVCKEENILNNLDYDTEEFFIIRGICDVSQSKPIKEVEGISSLSQEFIKALKSKDKVALERILDRDTEGLITNYYNSVGNQLITN